MIEEPLILPATQEEFDAAAKLPSDTTWFARVSYTVDYKETEDQYFKFVRAYEVRISDFYSLGGYPIKQITIV